MDCDAPRLQHRVCARGEASATAGGFAPVTAVSWCAPRARTASLRRDTAGIAMAFATLPLRRTGLTCLLCLCLCGSRCDAQGPKALLVLRPAIYTAGGRLAGGAPNGRGDVDHDRHRMRSVLTRADAPPVHLRGDWLSGAERWGVRTMMHGVCDSHHDCSKSCDAHLWHGRSADAGHDLPNRWLMRIVVGHGERRGEGL